MKYLIDDERDFLPNHTVPDMIARTWEAAELVMSLLKEEDELYIDHDLGDENPNKTGYRLLAGFESFIAYKQVAGVYVAIPRKITCISSNPPGRERINQVIASIKRLQKQGLAPD